MTTPKRPQTVAEQWEQATLANNFIFCKVMSENKDLCRRLLEILLHVKIARIERPLAEKTVKVDFDAHGIRLDVYTADSTRAFDIEVQTTNKKDLPKRARYYQSLIDVDNLKTGEDYNSLKESYIIFLCMDDVFGKGLPVYRFENVCAEDPSIKLEDNAYKIFFNAQKYDIMPSKEEQAFFRYLQGKKAESKFTRLLATAVDRAKQNTQWRYQFMTWEQSIKEEAIIRAEEMAKEMAEEKARAMAADLAKEIAEQKLKVMAEKVIPTMAKQKAEVLAKQIAEEKAKAMAENLAEQKAEAITHQKILQVARTALSMGLSPQQAAQLADLPLAEVQAL